MPNRINPIAQYLITLAMTILAYSMYAQFAIPLIEGPPSLLERRPSPRRLETESVDRRQQYQHLFPDDAWELGTSNMLQTPQGKILFQDYQTQPDGTLIVFPFTMIMKGEKDNHEDPSQETTLATDQKTDSKMPPTVLRCLQEARIKFDRPFTLSGSNQSNGSGRMESATLNGDVIIYRPPSSPQKDDALRIETSNIKIDKQNIRTLEDVEFKLGPNCGRGRNLLIQMAHARPVNSITADISNVDGIRRVELAFLEYMRIVPSRSDAQPTTPDSTNPTEFLSGVNTPLEITCKGPFVFDFDKKIVTLRDQVVVKQLDQFEDDLHCDELRLALQGDEQATTDPISNTGSVMRLKRITAIGTPAIINAHSRKSRIMGDRLDYNLESNEVFAQSETGSVTILNEQFQFDSRQFRYSIPKDNSLGPLKASGPGRMLRTATKKQGEFRASWKDLLTISDEPDGTKLIQLDGQSKVSINQDTHIVAEHLKFWLWPLPKTDTTASVANLSDANGPDANGPDANGSDANGSSTQGETKFSYQPARILAYGDVQIDSPRLTGTTRRLVALWPQPDNVSWVPVTESNLHVANSIRMRRPVYQESGQPQQTTDGKTERIAPANRNAQIKLAGFDAPIKPERKFQVDGDEIEATLSSQESGSEIRQVKINGNVRIEELLTQDSGDQPLKVTGHQLEMMPQGPDTYRIIVVGSEIQPAIVDTKGLHLTGQRLELLPQGSEQYRVKVLGSSQQRAIIVTEELTLEGVSVHLDQKANKLWVEGAGTIEMTPPVDLPNNRINTTSKPKPAKDNLGSPSRIHVSWGSGMVFDGRTIYFEKDVIMNISQTTQNATERKTKALSQALSLKLKHRIDFRSMADEKRDSNQEFEIEELILVDHLNPAQRVFQLAGNNNTQNSIQPVVVENQDFDKAGNLIEKQKVIVPRVTFKMGTGAIAALGPGTIMTHRMGKSSLPKTGKPTQSTPNSSGLSYLQVNFDGSVNANLDTQDMRISGNVRTLFTPVQNWNQSLNPDAVASLPPGAIKLTCETIEMSKWKPRGATETKNELIATGNTHVWGELFEATSDRVSYSQLTDLLIIEGTPRTDANLWYRQNPRAQRDHLVAGKILYRISDQWTSVQKIKNGSFSPSNSR